MYFAAVVRQILRIKEMMVDDLTIEQIQREILFVRGDIEELTRVFGRIFDSLVEATKSQARVGVFGRAVI